MFSKRGTYNITDPGSTSRDQRPSQNPLPKGHVRCTIRLLDDKILVEDFPKRVSGRALVDLVNGRIDLQETDYFGLQFVDEADKVQWLDPLKSVKKQIKGRKEMEFFFRVKFYIADPSNIQEELTRFLFFLQVKEDIFRNRLPVNFSTAAILSAYALQGEVGDFDDREHKEGYVSTFRFVPNQTEELEEQIEMHHKTLTGMLPADCEFHFLERAQRLELYGVDLHFAQDAEGEELMLGVTHSGVAVFQNKNKINSFHWAMMRKIGFKKHKFFLYIRGVENDNQPPIVGFVLPDYRSCKTLWKTCVSHHTFFRQRLPPPSPKMNGILRFGSKYRYSGRTLNMTVEHGKETVRPDYELRRPPSKRYQRRSAGGYSSMRATVAKKRELEAAQAAPAVVNGTSHQAPPKEATPSPEPPKPTEVYDEEYFKEEEESMEDNYPSDSVLVGGLLRIQMSADSEGRFGFNVRGGSDQRETVQISRISEGTPAAMSTPRLKEGDVVEQINGNEVSGLNHGQIVDLIRTTRTLADPTLIIIVKPTKPIPKSLLLENRSQDLLASVKRESQIRLAKATTPADKLKSSIQLLKEGLESAEAVSQFEQLHQRNPNMPHDDGFKTENFCRNRYRDISPYNSTRVKLDAENDYINASHVNVDASDTTLAYIAAQGPVEHTCVDFWQMVWEQNCNNVVMITKLVEFGRNKCAQYWPEAGSTRSFGKLEIATKEERSDDVLGTVRSFEVLNKEVNESRDVCQFQYVDWPDHGEPTSSSRFIEFVVAMNARRDPHHPLLVHCSAGVGRTGMFITMETALNLMRASEPVFPLEIVRSVRDQRPMVIQTSEQYKFVCNAIVSAYEEKLYGPTSDDVVARDNTADTRAPPPANDVSSSESSDSDSDSSGSDSSDSSGTSGSASEGEEETGADVVAANLANNADGDE